MRRDLAEYEDKQLTDELNRRIRLRRQCLCDYCGRPSSTKPCKFPHRHGLTKLVRATLSRYTDPVPPAI